MHIKQIVLRGFKSYRDELRVDPFHAGHNVIVGRNGSGKSNFFLAIRFVLGDLFTNLRPEERQQILHEGVGAAVLSASVEIIFDNGDNRLPVDHAEVSVRRVLGLKKDEYFIDNLPSSKADVANLLESAGFSRCNPYYIVQQGKVNTVALMKDAERLQLLKEVAGTRVYDDRRAESIKILGETNARREKIVELIADINERLSGLDSEKDELHEYQRLDKERRSLQYALYDRELGDVMQSLETIEATRAEENSRALDHRRAADRAYEDAREHEHDEKTIAIEVDGLGKDKESVEQERNDAIQRRMQLELDAQDLSAALATDTTRRDVLQKTLDEVTAAVADRKEALGAAQTRFDAAHDAESKLDQELSRVQAETKALYSRRGRASEFKSQQDRDNWIQRELASIADDFASSETRRANYTAEIDAIQARAQTSLQDAQRLRASLQARKEQLRKSEQVFRDAKVERDRLTDQRKELWRSEAQIENDIERFKVELAQCERQVSASIPKVLISGYQTIRDIQGDFPGCYGRLIDLLTFDKQLDKFLVAVEVTAGNSLFDIVVDTDETASRMLKILNERRGGRVTFMPLNQLRPRRVNFPESPDAMPLVKQLSFDDKYEKAFAQVFGQTLVCRNLAVATEFSRKHDLNCITLEGDQVNRKGALTGGFHDQRQLKLERIKTANKWRTKLDEAHEHKAKLKTSIEAIDQQVSNTLGETQKLETGMRQDRSAIQQTKMELATAEDSARNDGEALQRHKKALATLEVSIKQLEQQQAVLRDELGSEMQDTLSAADQERLASLEERAKALQEELNESRERRAEAEGVVINLQHEVEANLEKQQHDLVADLQELDVDARQQALDTLNDELAAATRHSDALRERVAAIEQKLTARQKDMLEATAKAEAARQTEAEHRQHLEGEVQQGGLLLGRRSNLLQKKEELKAKIRELGSLPSDVFERSQTTSVSKLHSMLRKVNEKLEKFQNVNKKALDQYNQFTEQRDTLMARQAEVNAGRQAIEDLLQVLDQKKDQAIQTTFRGVAKHFATVFSELVPGGRGSVVMITDDDLGEEELDEDGDAVMGDEGGADDMEIDGDDEEGDEDEEDDEEDDDDEGAENNEQIANKRRRSSSSKTKRKGKAKAKGKAKTPKKSKTSTPQRKDGPRARQYRGIAIKVSFTAAGETVLMQQLSGGQKSLVALALIFSIQRVDSAPFYIFDEVDSALDAAHRTAVAAMIGRQSEQGKAQFITTTFRPELVNAADKQYGIEFKNKVSKIRVIDRAVALTLLEEADGQQQAAS